MESELGNQLWHIYQDLKNSNEIGFLTDEDFQKYFLGLVSYKYLSLNIERYLDRKVMEDSKNDFSSFEEAWHDDYYDKSGLRDVSVKELGYFIYPELLFRNILHSNNNFKISDLNFAFDQISSSSMGTDSQEDFENLFESVDLYASTLGKTQNDKNRVILTILNALDSVDFDLNDYNSATSPDFLPILSFNPHPYQGRARAEFHDLKDMNLMEDRVLANHIPEKDYEKRNLSSEEKEGYDLEHERYSYKQYSSREYISENEMDSYKKYSSNEYNSENERDSYKKYSSREYKFKRQYSIGDAFEFLLSKFSLYAHKTHDFYTPHELSYLLSRLVSIGRDKFDAVYDPCCGSASLLLELNKQIDCDIICGQEVDTYYYNLARENMILHNLHFKKFEIKQGDSLENPQHRGKMFDAIVSQIPYGIPWSADKSLLYDERFKDFKVLPPSGKSEYGFIMHMIHYLKGDGVMAILAPLGVLFRGAKEEKIRKMIISDFNYLDAVIGLPANIYYSKNIPSCIMVFRKDRGYDDDILFIDASHDFKKVKLRNNLRTGDIDRIIETYENREEIKRYSHRADLREIIENDFNLNIPRYVDTFEAEDPIDLEKIYKRRLEVKRELNEITHEIDELCKEMGIENPLLK